MHRIQIRIAQANRALQHRVAREELGKWYIDEGLLAEMLDGLRRAGLEMAES